MFRDCKLYNLTRKKLYYLLCIENKKLEDLINNYRIFLIDNNRLVESPRSNLKKTHKIIIKYLDQITIPEWIKSQKGFSYIDNAIYHLGNAYILTLDLKGFSPNSHRDYI